MLTKNEITALSLSPTKKDFVQIWNELLEVAGKLSERWDPTSTNESDPGIVILKALTGIADKLNYNIDKNTLEAFMPTAAQEDSMRKLCDMLGYNVKYYRSAETTVDIKYYNSDPSVEEQTAMASLEVAIPKFTVITNNDKDISYFTINPVPRIISSSAPSVSIKCMEGQVVKCESIADNNVITSSQISENNRFYLPEAQVAENGIFIYNVYSLGTTLEDGTAWEKVDNLNVQARGSRVFKFGYDSYESRPYVEFPEDYSELINDGLFIYYTRTSGANGNISPGTLTQLEIPSSWKDISAESFSVKNAFAATTGANIETIQQAYNNFKKTIGTFETLVTCRDYMNKICTMVDESTNKSLVSNALVADIRNDLNRAVTICSCDDTGIFYKETSLMETTTKKFKRTGSTEEVEVDYAEPAINHFDLVIYPFKSYSQIKSNIKNVQEAYDSSFKYDSKSFNTIKNILNAKEDNSLKTVAHNIESPRNGDIVCINNYLRLNAIIGTNTKISSEEGALLKETIKIALANAFNMRELDFGEDIPFDSIVDTIEKADARIKVVSLNEPALYTTFSVFEGIGFNSNPVIKEYAVASEWLTEDDADRSGRFDMTKNSDGVYAGTFDSKKAKEIYNKLAVRNILAGRIPLFNYNNTFATSFSEGPYRTTKVISASRIPTGLAKPTLDNPFTLYVDQDKIYTGQRTLISEKPEELEAPSSIKPATEQLLLSQNIEYSDENGTMLQSDNAEVLYIGEWNESTAMPVYSKVIYTETSTPFKDNLIAKEPTSSANITEISTSCKIYADNGSNSISGVTLSDGEFVRFRAPNFITTKTYPAYVNYHLQLVRSNDATSAATPASASTLFELLNGNGTNTNWEKVFSSLSEYKKTFTLTQKVSINGNVSGLVLNQHTAANTTEKAETLLAKSGCVRLCNNGVPIIEGSPAVATSTGIVSINKSIFNVTLDNSTSWFITNKEAFAELQNKVNTAIGNPGQYTKDWTISYKFEYIPFDASTLAAWERFAREGNCGFTPKEDANVVLWRAYGDSYTVGKLILSNGAKLLPFSSGAFGLLDSLASRLHGIYLITDLGADAKVNFIGNNEEYELRNGEYLFIEYTPSTTTTTTESSTQAPSAVKEVHGPGTIIRPSGFEEGLINSIDYAKDHSALKVLTFNEPSTDSKAMFSFGPNEQVEIRELSRVLINKKLFEDSPVVHIYKNFSGCAPLEGAAQFEKGERINSSYTLKEGEYIFYTDENKSELAYFGSGTEVTLTGRTVLPVQDVIDISTIFDNGIQDIPWYRASFAGEQDGIILQEYQYVTLGPGDTLENLTIVDPQVDESDPQSCLSEKLQYCDHVTYVPAGEDTATNLPKINVSTAEASIGNGWEASSVLELNASPSNAQTLRKTDKVTTSLTLHKDTSAVSSDNAIKVEAEEGKPLSFKTNLACQSSNGNAKIAELPANSNNLVKSFELKVLSGDGAKILKTEPDTLIPFTGSAPDIDSFTAANYSDLWSQVSLSVLKPNHTDTASYDRALKLPVSLLPNTYGVFSIYLDYRITEEEAKTWVELPPGVHTDTITLLNADDSTAKIKHIASEASQGDGIEPTSGSQLELMPGLNCIQVNNTCDLYIKTLPTSEGILYFDELRLVDATEIDYKVNGETKRISTKGLNLAQSGYFDTSDESTLVSNVFDIRARKQLKTEFTNAALTDINKKITEADEYLTATWEELVEVAPKIENITEYLIDLVSEVESLKAAVEDDQSEASRIESLLSNYKNVLRDLEQEIALKEALANSEYTNELEQQLIATLAGFAGIETIQAEVLAKLDTLKDTVLEKVETFDKLQEEDILDDFILVADTSTYTTLLTELKIASLNKINAQYADQLERIANDLQNIAESDYASKLETALNALYKKSHASLVAQVSYLMKINLEDVSKKVTTLLATARGTTNDNVTTVNYQQLVAELTELREYIINSNIFSLITQINTGVEEQRYEELKQPIEDLQALLVAEDTILVKNIDSLLKKVQDIVVDEVKEPDSELIANITNLQSYINDTRNENIQAVLDNISNTVDTLSNKYSSALASLQDVTDNEVKELAARLTVIADARNTLAEKVAGFGIGNDFNIRTDYISLPFVEDVITELWSGYLKTDFTNGIDKLCANMRNNIKKKRLRSTDEFANELSNITEFYSKELTERVVLTAMINVAEFKEIYDTAKWLPVKAGQNAVRERLIEHFSDLIGLPKELVNSMNAIKNDSDSDRLDRNVVISNIVHLLLENNGLGVVEKQQLITTLAEELEKEILLDSTLVRVSASVLLPNFLLFKDLHPEMQTDSFYSPFADWIESLTHMFIQGSGSGIALDLTNILTSIKPKLHPADVNGLIDIKDALVTGDKATLLEKITKSTLEHVTSILLPTKTIKVLRDFKNMATYKQEALNVTKNTLFSLLTKQDLVVAWAYSADNSSNTYWVDSAGKKFKATSDILGEKWQTSTDELVEIDVKHTAAGTWLDKSGNIINLDNVATWIDTSEFISLSEDQYVNELINAVNGIVNTLVAEVSALGQVSLPEYLKEVHDVIKLENQLLDEIRRIDSNRYFYYNAPIEQNVAIDFIESDARLNTLMNPAANYDINNVNNNFVISKLDINYLTDGLQIARSSRI